MGVKITLPYRFQPRPYQKEALDAFGKYKRMALIWHRRAGKDKTAFQMLIKGALTRVGVYYYVFPEYAQGRKVVWDAIDNDGMRMLNHIPPEVIESTNEQQMKIMLKNGSIIQIVGTDKKIDNIVGTNPMGCLFSEFPISDPRGWDLMRPILTVNQGWAIFVFTPRGKNHGWLLKEVARKNHLSWFLSVKTVDDTVGWDGEPIVTREMVESERRDGMAEDLIQQEYYVSFEASVVGAYYADQIRQARAENRICKVPYDKHLDVYTAWDIGYDDYTSIWFFQIYGQEVRFIDHYESAGEQPAHYVQVINDRGYKYGTHYLPHDANAGSFQTGTTSLNILKALGLRNIKVLERDKHVQVGIDLARQYFKNAWFDEDKCEAGLNCLTSYHKEFNAKNQVYQSSPKHDWSSHTADAFRYAMKGASETLKRTRMSNAYSNTSIINTPHGKMAIKSGVKFYDYLNNSSVGGTDKVSEFFS